MDNSYLLVTNIDTLSPMSTADRTFLFNFTEPTLIKEYSLLNIM